MVPKKRGKDITTLTTTSHPSIVTWLLGLSLGPSVWSPGPSVLFMGPLIDIFYGFKLLLQIRMIDCFYRKISKISTEFFCTSVCRIYGAAFLFKKQAETILHCRIYYLELCVLIHSQKSTEYTTLT